MAVNVGFLSRRDSSPRWVPKKHAVRRAFLVFQRGLACIFRGEAGAHKRNRNHAKNQGVHPCAQKVNCPIGAREADLGRWFTKSPPATSMMIRVPVKQKNGQAKACPFFWCSSGASLAFAFPCGGRESKYRCSPVCALVHAHAPGVCGQDSSPRGAKKTDRQKTCLFFWCSSGDSNPGHPA